MANMFGQRFESAQLHLVEDKQIDNQLLILFLFVEVAKKVEKKSKFLEMA